MPMLYIPLVLCEPSSYFTINMFRKKMNDYETVGSAADQFCC